jgi:hypothetical protein
LRVFGQPGVKLGPALGEQAPEILCLTTVSG